MVSCPCPVLDWRRRLLQARWSGLQGAGVVLRRSVRVGAVRAWVVASALERASISVGKRGVMAVSLRQQALLYSCRRGVLVGREHWQASGLVPRLGELGEAGATALESSPAH